VNEAAPVAYVAVRGAIQPFDLEEGGGLRVHHTLAAVEAVVLADAALEKYAVEDPDLLRLLDLGHVVPFGRVFRSVASTDPTPATPLAASPSHVRRTPGIGYEAVPACCRGGAGMGRHAHSRNHAAESFVSFTPC
jgi:hypothetical protein